MSLVSARVVPAAVLAVAVLATVVFAEVVSAAVTAVGFPTATVPAPMILARVVPTADPPAALPAVSPKVVPAVAEGRQGSLGKEAPPPVPAISSLHRNPTIRIGLTTDRTHVSISCKEGFRVTDAATGEAVWKESYREALMIGLRGPKPAEGRTFRVQVASFAAREPAEALAAKLRAETSEPVIVAWSADRGAWRVRVGAADARAALTGVVEHLRSSGHTEIWIADEPIPQIGTGALVLVDEDYNTAPVEAKILAIEPVVAGALVALEGAAYRGTLEARLDVSGGIRVVDVVPLEAYLRGVVPAELGPAQYPEIEALKAQAVAARTYVYRNLGQFSEDGFDLCDTPRCQVYGGVKVEHALSDRAVQETEGEIALYDGKPIDALYTSTCGGHTEDASEIFPERAEPYLVGVSCAPERRSKKNRTIALEGTSAVREAIAEEARAAALLAVHGLIPRSVLEPSELSAPVTDQEAGAWIDALGSACGIENPGAEGAAADSRRSRTGEASARSRSGSKGRGPTLAALASRLIARLGWGPRVDLLVGREEAGGWLVDDPRSLDDEEIGAVAYFLRQKGWPAAKDGAPAPERQATRGDLARLLLHVAEDCDVLQLDEGIVRGGSASGLKVSGKDLEASPALARGALLFADAGSGPVPVAKLGLVQGDKIRFHLGPSGTIDLLLVLPGRQGTSDDRFSGVSSWQVAYTAHELGNRLDEYVGEGELIDIVPLRRGASGRITQLRVVGTGGERIVNGFDIRTALGLRENLFVIARQKDRKGALHRVVFTGRGWGHGVGMCQVGAYGMALRGATHREILKHYYSGITLERLP